MKKTDFLEKIIEGSANITVATDMDGKITFASSGAEKTFGYGKGEAIGTHISRYYAGGLEEAKRIGKIIRKEGKLYFKEIDFLKKDRTIVTFSTSYDLLRDNEGRAVGVVAVGKDVTGKKRVERDIEQVKDPLESLIDGITDPIVTTDKKGIVTYINKGMTEVLGYNTEIIGKHISIAYSGGIEETKKLMGILREKGKFNSYETLFTKKDGSLLPALLSISLLRDERGGVIGTLWICKDITERKRLEDELKETKNFLESVLEGSVDGITVLDRRGNVIFAAKGAGEMLGYDKGFAYGTHISKYYGGGVEEAKKIMALLRKEGKLRNYETTLKAADGHIVPISVSISLLRDDKGEITSSLGVYKDITEKKKFEKELEKLSITDNLTGLYNQRHFYNELKREIERAKRFKHPLSLVLFDIDTFKHYNDTYGHLEGDKALCEVGKVLSKSIRGNVDSGYRYGGDEFVVILPETDKNRAFSLAERIRTSFNNIGLVDVTLSIGLVEYRTEYDPETFVRHADKAMYTAKHQGGDRVSIHE
jgi:diguanylate cyclase (GGDEF)-like protein/PAS domain S-box-containing protein